MWWTHNTIPSLRPRSLLAALCSGHGHHQNTTWEQSYALPLCPSGPPVLWHRIGESKIKLGYHFIPVFQVGHRLPWDVLIDWLTKMAHINTCTEIQDEPQHPPNRRSPRHTPAGPGVVLASKGFQTLRDCQSQDLFWQAKKSYFPRGTWGKWPF